MSCKTKAAGIGDAIDCVSGNPGLKGVRGDGGAVQAKYELRQFACTYGLLFDERQYDEYYQTAVNENKSAPREGLGAVFNLIMGNHVVNMDAHNAYAFYRCGLDLLTEKGWYYPPGSKIPICIQSLPDQSPVVVYEVEAGNRPRLLLTNGIVDYNNSVGGTDDCSVMVPVGKTLRSSTGYIHIPDPTRPPNEFGDPQKTTLKANIHPQSTRLVIPTPTQPVFLTYGNPVETLTLSTKELYADSDLDSYRRQLESDGIRMRSQDLYTALKVDGEIVGLLSFGTSSIDTGMQGWGEIRFHISPEYRGVGLTEKAAPHLMAAASQRFGVNRFYFNCEDDNEGINPASAHIAEKLGFKETFSVNRFCFGLNASMFGDEVPVETQSITAEDLSNLAANGQPFWQPASRAWDRMQYENAYADISLARYSDVSRIGTDEYLRLAWETAHHAPHNTNEPPALSSADSDGYAIMARELETQARLSGKIPDSHRLNMLTTAVDILVRGKGPYAKDSLVNLEKRISASDKISDGIKTDALRHLQQQLNTLG